MARKGQLHQTLDPESIRLLVQVFGPGKAIWVPSSTAHAERFEVVLGLVETTRLIDTFGGGTVYLPGLPKGDGKPRGPTLAEVASLSESMSAAQIAQRFHVSTRTIYNKRDKLRRLKEGRRGKGNSPRETAKTSP